MAAAQSRPGAGSAIWLFSQLPSQVVWSDAGEIDCLPHDIVTDSPTPAGSAVKNGVSGRGSGPRVHGCRRDSGGTLRRLRRGAGRGLLRKRGAARLLGEIVDPSLPKFPFPPSPALRVAFASPLTSPHLTPPSVPQTP